MDMGTFLLETSRRSKHGSIFDVYDTDVL